METTDFFGSFGLGGVDTGAIVSNIYYFVGIGLLLAVLGGIIFILFYMRMRNKTSIGRCKIGWWNEVGERLEPSFQEDVQEIIIPGTILRIFYGKKRNIWLPRFSRGVSKDLFYVTKTKSGQMVNFELGNLSKNLKESKLIFDHTDMLWAAENSREFIKKNYSDKAETWWKLYQNTISVIVLLFVMTFSFVLIIYFMRGIVQDIGGVASQLSNTLERTCSAAQGSGLVNAGGG